MALAQGRFGRDQRIRKRSEYRRILNGGVRVPTAHCVFVVGTRPLPSVGESCPRLGLVVSRKVGKAVLRNRFKRLAREVFRKSRASLPSDAEIVFIARHWEKGLLESVLAAEWSQAQPKIHKAIERHRLKSRGTSDGAGGSC